MWLVDRFIHAAEVLESSLKADDVWGPKAAGRTRQQAVPDPLNFVGTDGAAASYNVTASSVADVSRRNRKDVVDSIHFMLRCVAEFLVSGG